MRIDGTYRPQAPAGSLDAMEGAKARKAPDTPRPAPEAAEAQSISADSLAAYVAQARQHPAVRAEAVSEARRMMEAGQLDTPEAIQGAAEAIFSRGC